MRKVTILVLLVVLCLVAIPTFAQTETPSPTQPTTPAEGTAEATLTVGASTAIMNPMNLVGTDNVTFVRFVNTVVDVPSVDLYVQELGDQALVTDLAFGKVTDAMLLPAGEHNVVVRAAGSGVAGEALTNMKWNFQPDTSWLVTLMGQDSNKSVQLEPISLLRNDIANDVARVRVVNLVAGTSELKVGTKTGDDFGQALNWADMFDADMKAGTYNLNVTTKDEKALLTDAPVDLRAGALTTVLLAGNADGTTPVQFITFDSPADVSRIQFVNNSSAPIQIFVRPSDTELVSSLAAGETSDWVTVPSGSVTFVAYAPGTGPSGQELGSWIGTVQPMRDITVSFTKDNATEASDPVFSPPVDQ